LSEHSASPKHGFAHPVAFWLGIMAVIVGVLLHLPDYVESRDMGYRMVGMGVSPEMAIGMLLVFVGVALTVYGLFPGTSHLSQVSKIQVRALDDAPMKPAHVLLLLVMALAVTIDVMKPTNFSFVVPGAALEYGLRSPLNPDARIPVSLYPLAGITGTMIGSFMWGWVGDVLGRRGAILLSGVLFMGTATCGAMPEFWMNLIVCFIMGVGVGGMLPISFALMAETIPARHRGWLMVLVGGDVAGAYIITSALSAWLVPEYSWRILWLIGLPTGAMLIFLQRFIPESPRFLLARGRDDEARQVMERYGATIVETEDSDLLREEQFRSSYSQLLRPPFIGPSLILVMLGAGIGLVTFGFQLWIPSNLQALGFSEVSSSSILRDSALIGFPATFVVAFLYGFWSSKKTMVILAGLTVVALAGFIVAGDSVANNKTLLYALLVLPITGITSLQAVVIAYGSEVYPTRIRSRGTGLAAGATKAGGVLVIALVVAAVAAPSIALTALIGAVPLGVATVALAFFGIETRRRRLEEITAQELAVRATGAG
jgi:putative MFS transporter